MTLNLKIALTIMVLVYVFLILKTIRSKKLQLSFSIFWLVSGFLLLIAILIPNLIEYLTKLLGFEMPVNMLFCITIFIEFYLIFNLTVKLSNENKKNILLTQEISLLKKRVKDIEEGINNEK